MIGFWVVEKFTGPKDAAGFDCAAWCAYKMDMNIKAALYLPPYLRQSQCDISEGDCVFGLADETTGIGAALFGEGAADFQYFVNADVEIRKKLTVGSDITSKNGNIKASVGDVKATSISLKSHTHTATLNISGMAGEIPVTGTATGTTNTPQ
jgi:hypothetical protein